MLSRSLLVPSTGSSSEFFVATSSTPFDPDTDAAGPNNALNLVRAAQRQRNVVATPDILNESAQTNRRIDILGPGAAKPAGMVVLPSV